MKKTILFSILFSLLFFGLQIRLNSNFSITIDDTFAVLNYFALGGYAFFIMLLPHLERDSLGDKFDPFAIASVFFFTNLIITIFLDYFRLGISSNSFSIFDYYIELLNEDDVQLYLSITWLSRFVVVWFLSVFLNDIGFYTPTNSFDSIFMTFLKRFIGKVLIPLIVIGIFYTILWFMPNKIKLIVMELSCLIILFILGFYTFIMIINFFNIMNSSSKYKETRTITKDSYGKVVNDSGWQFAGMLSPPEFSLPLKIGMVIALIGSISILIFFRSEFNDTQIYSFVMEYLENVGYIS